MVYEESIRIARQDVVLCAEKSLFLPAENTLVLSDLHLGKASHFQRHGLAIPGEVAMKDLQRLESLIGHYSPEHVVIAGDLFHAAHNSEWNLFLQWLEKWPDTSFHLVKGNHDRLDETFYHQAGLLVHPVQYDLTEGRVIHIPSPVPDNDLEIAGHIHPGIKIRGRGRQRLRAPCFVIRPHQIILPAFGYFTGLDTRFTRQEDEIFAVIENEVVRIT